MDFVDIKTGEVLAPADLAARHPNVSFAWPPTDESLAPFGIGILHPSPAPAVGLYQRRVRDGAAQDAQGVWRMRWAVQEVTDPQERASILRVAVLSQRLWVEGMVRERLDTEAKRRGYDTIQSAALRAAYPGPYQAEGLALASWMDGCWAAAYALLADFAPEMGLEQVQAALDASLPAPPG